MSNAANNKIQNLKFLNAAACVVTRVAVLDLDSVWIHQVGFFSFYHTPLHKEWGGAVLSAARRPRPANILTRPRNRTVAIAGLGGGEVPGRAVDPRTGQYLRNSVVRLRGLLGDPAQCLGGRGLHRHLAGIAAPIFGAAEMPHVS